MLKSLNQLLLGVCGASCALAIPNTIIGDLAQVNSPLNGQDITDRILAAGVWDGGDSLPGEWKREAVVAGSNISHLRALPKVLGEDVVLLRSVHRKNKLESLVVTFVDAGSFFQYQPRVRKDQLAAQREALAAKQRRFEELYQKKYDRIKKQLADLNEEREKRVKQGASRTLRAEVEVFQKGKLKFGLLADGKRMIRLTISRDMPHKKSWLDSSIADMTAYEREKHFREKAMTGKHGDVLIDGISVVPQGYKPYCGINVLVMSAHYFGLHVDEDWLAVAGKFENTGSAGSSNMLGLYNATAKEARLKLSRETKFDFHKARALLRDGMPVIVWRRFDQGRNRVHRTVSKKLQSNPDAKLPAPNTGDRASWPGEKHPVHASVIVGFNDERKEVLFLESWAGAAVPSRMRYEGMEATATYAFYFRNR